MSELKSSRRNFIAAGLLVPAGASASLSLPAPPAPPPAAPKLTYGTLGKTGLKLTKVGFGCMITSDPTVIERAADSGINYFDTARGYQGGNNERMVGAALKSRRSKLHISTKSHGRTKEAALNDLDTSLRELGTDYVDIWYLHGLSKVEDATDELLEAQRLAKQQGKIRYAGVSTHSNMKDLIPALVAKGQTDVVLSAYNFTMEEGMSEAVRAARKAGMGIVAMKVMAGGFRRVKKGDKLFDTFQKQGAMLAALKWVLNNEGVDTTVPSITDGEQLDENLRAMTEHFSDNDKTILSRHLNTIQPLYCRMCGSCSGRCKKGIPVADVLRYLTYAEGYGQFALGRERYLELPAGLRAVQCNDCRECRIHCPNGVMVSERLIRAQELFA